MTTAYYQPTTIDEAVKLLGSDPAGAGVVAGGTDVVVAARSGKKPLPSALIAVHRISELQGINRNEDGSSRLGALVTYADIEGSEILRSKYTALVDASSLIGSIATRHVGTLGGNLCNGSPAMETGSPLLVYEALVEIASVRGARLLPIAEFMTGPGTTALASGELLTSVVVPELPEGSVASAYLRLEYRRAMEIAVVGAAALVVVDQGELVNARLALTAVAPTCIRVPDAEAVLRGQASTPEVYAKAGRVAAEEAAPIDDVRASADYRRAVIPVLVARALKVAVDRARGEDVPIPAARVFDE